MAWGHALLPSYDLISQSVSGVARMTAFRKTGLSNFPTITVIFSRHLGVIGVLSALHHRERTGKDNISIWRKRKPDARYA